jgi:hypothetical protein
VQTRVTALVLDFRAAADKTESLDYE